MAPALLQLAAVFPEPRRWARWRLAGYVPALVLLILYQWYLYQPHPYTVILQTNMAYLGLAGILLGAQLVWAYVRGRSAVGSQRVRVVTLWTVLAMALPGAVLVTSAIMGGRVSINLTAFAVVPFPLALAYAIVKHDLFQLDAMVKRGAYYLLLTGAVGAAYVGAIFLFNRALPGAVTDSAAVPDPLHPRGAGALRPAARVRPGRARPRFLPDRLRQRAGTRGRGSRARVGAHPRAHRASGSRQRTERDPERRARDSSSEAERRGFEEVGGIMMVPPILPSVSLAAAACSPTSTRRRATRTRRPPSACATRSQCSRPRSPCRSVPTDELVGVLTAGPKRSGLFYTAGDADFLRALAHQAAIALQNAASYEELVALNATLEERVRERTAQLEASNRRSRRGPARSAARRRCSSCSRRRWRRSAGWSPASRTRSTIP